jgi:hypothetical protein
MFSHNTSVHRFYFLGLCSLLLLCGCAPQVSKVPSVQASSLKPEEVPTFELRARAVSAGKDKTPIADKKFSFRWGTGLPGETVSTQGDAWSEWIKFDRPQAEAVLKGYPALYMKGYPIIVRLQVSGVVDPTVINAELKLNETGEVVPLQGELFGPNLGLVIWRDEANKPHALTMASYNQRYWKALEGAAIPAAQRLKKFPIVDRFIGGDDDRRDWREGIDNLSKVGFSALMLPGSATIRELLLETGSRRTAGAVYNPPGYAFEFGMPGSPNKKATEQEIADWAQKQAKPFLDAGYAPTDMAIYAMSDEPGWYFPSVFKSLIADPTALARFHDYIKSQGLSAQDVGAASWDGVLPIGRSDVKDLPSRRLFYWTMRFYAWDSSRHFANSTRALEKAFYPGIPVFTNWNFFSGRFYVPGPVANNPDKQDPSAAMGGHDWLEFGRMRGGTMLWTEDWFPDSMAYQWSFYASKLASGARKGGVQFGGYVIPRTSGDREDGMMQKVLSIVGNGGKGIKYFVFGPEYNFPGNCYSENSSILRKMAEAHRMVGSAEDLLWPGQHQQAQVAILQPQSSQLWDENGISDATNNHLNSHTVDYMAEVADLYLALQHTNTPADFVEEQDLSPEGLKPYKVLYVTEPNLPTEWQKSLAEWVRGGGTLVTVSNAATRDRYDQPDETLSTLTGLKTVSRDRLPMANLDSAPQVAKGKSAFGDFTAFGARDTLPQSGGLVKATFDDGTPAIVEKTVGRGRQIHFAWMPGISYMKSSSTTKDKLPVGFSDAIRNCIVYPTRVAGVQLPVTVDRAMIETPLLLSKSGGALTLLNWSGEKLGKASINAHVPFKVQSVTSVKLGRIPFQKTKTGVSFSLPLGGADIVLLRPR